MAGRRQFQFLARFAILIIVFYAVISLRVVDAYVIKPLGAAHYSGWAGQLWAMAQAMLMIIGVPSVAFACWWTRAPVGTTQQ